MKKKLFLIAILSTIVFEVFSQSTNSKIYFLADTINTTKRNQVLHIEPINPFEYVFTFYCICATPYKNYVSFSCITKKGEKRSKIVSKKPNYPYLSFKELMDIVNKYNINFNNSYDLHITEVLPNNKYRTNKVHFVPYSPPTQDGVILKEK